MTRFRCNPYTTLIALLALWLNGWAVAGELVEVWPDADLVGAVTNGGYVLYFRHGKTDSSIPDQPRPDPDDCTAQRPLTESGRQELKAASAYLAQLGWDQNIEELIVSPFCRARESAELLFPNRETTIDPLQMYTASLTAAERLPINERTATLLSQAVFPGLNRVIVAHGPNIAEIMDYFPDEGTLVIFRPSGQDYHYLASVRIEDWSTLIELIQR